MSREERKVCCVSTWQLPTTESLKQIHLARSDMKSKLQVLGSLGMPKPTDRQQKESATETTTAQPSSMVRRGGTGKSERGGREGGKGSAPGSGPPLQAARKQQLMAMKGSHFFPSKTKPFPAPTCPFCYQGSPLAQTGSECPVLSITFSLSADHQA